MKRLDDFSRSHSPWGLTPDLKSKSASGVGRKCPGAASVPLLMRTSGEGMQEAQIAVDLQACVEALLGMEKKANLMLWLAQLGCFCFVNNRPFQGFLQPHPTAAGSLECSSNFLTGG